MQNTKTGSPFGSVDRALIDDLKSVAGISLSESGLWVILVDEVNHWQISKEENLRTNEKRSSRKTGLLPVRFYNFLYAMAKCDDDIEKAINYAEEKLLVHGFPVYLPDLLARKSGLDNTEDRHFTYGKILRDIKEDYISKLQI